MVGNSIHGERAFAYIRTSMNASQTSADDQYCAISDYCEEHDVKLDSVYTVAGTPEFASTWIKSLRKCRRIPAILSSSHPDPVSEETTNRQANNLRNSPIAVSVCAPHRMI